ncbi:hypothetical protein GUJ93_ZPchr0013g34642 [Zizania palustris]|uniref:Uncharacterized protein n=1 Tax=Zizania palustris TaxID=103762 RepID=A0A8J5WRT5_ZIZPA|nr:hypothetical protein GUJ93_ZPchr0013g34642 [Zizania palustris]
MRSFASSRPAAAASRPTSTASIPSSPCAPDTPNPSSVTIHALSDRGVHAASFFDWLALRRGFSVSAAAHNLLVENAGRLADYQAMSRALASMSARQVPLTERAFAFLTLSRGGARDTTIAILRTLDEVGGPCR